MPKNPGTQIGTASHSEYQMCIRDRDEIVDYIKDHSLVREEDTELGIR